MRHYPSSGEGEGEGEGGDGRLLNLGLAAVRAAKNDHKFFLGDRWGLQSRITEGLRWIAN